jgi:hypothetical protein
MGYSATTGLSAAERTPPMSVNAAVPLDPGRRQVLHPNNAFGHICNVLTGASHDRPSDAPRQE